MRSSSVLATLLPLLSPAAAVYQGFNYDSGVNFADAFAAAKNLVGTSGFTSARLYTTLAAGSTTEVTPAIQAAIDTQTTLLLGIWASAGQATVTNEITALQAAIAQHGTAFTDLIAGISVGSEDLYRITPTWTDTNTDPGAEPATVIDYISQVRAAIADTPANAVPVGHVDTWTAWVNGSNSDVVAASDFIGTDAYAYYEKIYDNTIDNAADLFWSAHDQTVAYAQGKPVWITETGWPTTGPQVGNAVASVANAAKYYQDVGCAILGNLNVWWYTLQDAGSETSFGVVGAGDPVPTTPIYSLTC